MHLRLLSLGAKTFGGRVALLPPLFLAAFILAIGLI